MVGSRRAVIAALGAAAPVLVLALLLGGALGTGGGGARAAAAGGSGSRSGAAAGGALRFATADGAASRSGTAGGGASRAAAVGASSSAKYGGLPSWLPRPKMRVRRLLTATSAHPALSIQGETVAVDLPGGHVLATVAGPEVPEEGHFPVPATTPCTFILTLASASGTVPLRAADFTFVDDHGGIHHPQVSALHGGVVPTSAPPGRTVSLKLYDVLPTGDGGLEWAPGGGRPPVGWDYTVEID